MVLHVFSYEIAPVSVRVLYSNWDAYNERKTADRNFFDAGVEWEKEFLVEKVCDVFPAYTEETVRSIIEETAQLIGNVHKRMIFIDCVMIRLKSRTS